MPKRVNWGAMPVEATHVTEHSLAGFVERADRELDVQVTSASALRAVREARRASEEVGGPRKRIERDESARWASEIEVVRACVKNGPPRASSTRMGGDLGRALDRQALGTSGIASTSRAYEPDLGSDHYRHAWRVWTTALISQEREILTRTFASLVAPNDGGADRYARTIRAHLQHGKLADAEASLPACAVMLPLEDIRVHGVALASILVAIALGWAVDGETEITRWPDSQVVRREVAVARAKFRDALRRVELDASGESLTRLGDRLPSGTRPLLIPAPSMRELAEPPRAVAACLGLGAMVDGLRQDCEVDVVVMRVGSATPCPVCNRPRRTA